MVNAYFRCIFTPFGEGAHTGNTAWLPGLSATAKNLMSCRSQRYVVCKTENPTPICSCRHKGTVTAGETAGCHYGSIWSMHFIYFPDMSSTGSAPSHIILEISQFIFQCSREWPLTYLCRCCPAAQWKFKYSALRAQLCRISENQSKGLKRLTARRWGW